MSRKFATMQEFHDWLYSEPEVTVKVPGKLFIAGEYAVTEPEGMALVAAIDSDFSVTIRWGGRQSTLRTNIGLESVSFKLADLAFPGVIKAQPEWNFAFAAIRKLQAALKEKLTVEVEIDIQSSLGFAEDKKGYGSSAAVTCGIIKALNKFYDLRKTLKQQFEIAAAAHFEVQGSGSGGDIAAITYGGVVLYRSQDLIKRIKLPEDWETYVLSTSKAVKTGNKLSAVKLSEEFIAKSNTIVEKISQPNDFSVFKQNLLENQALLRENLPAGYVTEELDFALRAVNSHPRMAGKISGSGFGENMIVFSNGVSQGELDLLNQTLEKRAMKLEVINIAPSNR